jgi:hypothetical protein
MNTAKLLKTIEEEFETSLDGSLFDAEDNMKFAASIPVIDKIAFSDLVEYAIEKYVLEQGGKELEDLKNGVEKRIDALNSPVKNIPQFIKDKSHQRFKEIDEDKFFFITSENAGSLAIYLSENRCDTWKRVGGFYGLPTTDSKYPKKGISSIDFTIDKVKLEDGTELPAARIYWIDTSYRIKTSVINPLNGIYLNEEIVVDTTAAKLVDVGNLVAVKNSRDDKLVIYSETDGNHYNAFAMVKGGNKSIWIGIPFLPNNGYDDKVSDVIVVDDDFYVTITNNTNRIYVVRITQNEQGDFEKEIIIRDDVKYTDVRTYLVGDKIWILSAEQNVLEINPKGDFVFKETSMNVHTGSKYFTLLNDGRYLKANTNEVWEGSKRLYRLPEFINISAGYPALKNEIKTLMPINKINYEDGSEVGLVDFNLIDANPVVKGI